ncbi:triacylglycerol lipase 5 [Trichomonascus vanleenenianus]|uniref:triacylglycerol lipase 5 n=1 Tax=Trichomonascus vanleenenianus TaxID=2268995 RepID=UPI003ECA99DA
MATAAVERAWGAISGYFISPEQREINRLLEKQKSVESYEDWLKISQELDCLLGNDEWKKQKECSIYHYAVIEASLERFKKARLSNNTEELLNLVRTSLQRNLGNMGDTKLYSNCYTGTKLLIEQYIAEIEETIETLMNSSSISDEQLLSTLIQTRKSFGRTALVLSGGGTFGILHIGVLRELHREKLLPRIVSGSSAGSIFASLLCTHLDDEVEQLLQLPLFKEDFDIFEETGREESITDRIARFLKYGTWFDNKYLSNTMRDMLGDITFQEAYYRTHRVLNVTVSPSSVHEMPKLLNYLTAPNVLIWSAVCASCSVPLVFASYDILAKHPQTGQFYSWSPSTFIDGSVDNDLPLSRLSEMFNVNHFIACQVNPHIVPFVHLSEHISGIDSEERDNTRRRNMWHSAMTIVRNELLHVLLLAGEFGPFRNVSTKFRSLLTQQYSGDITILPEINISELGRMFRNPSKESFRMAELRAAQATWPKMSVIRNHCTIELSLDKAIHRLRTRIFAGRVWKAQCPVPAGKAPHGHTKQTPHHYRQKSDGLAVKYLVRRRSYQDVRQLPWSVAVTRKNSHADLNELQTTVSIDSDIPILETHHL